MFAGGKKKPGTAAGRSGSAGLSFIGNDVVVSGDVTSGSSIHIDGRIEGNVRCETLIQGEGGTIAGHIHADTAHLSGLVDGTVKARLLTLEPSARVTGDVTYETLSIAAGASIEGRLARKEGGQVAESAPVRRLAPADERKRPRATAAEEPVLLPNLDAPAAAAAG